MGYRAVAVSVLFAALLLGAWGYESEVAVAVGSPHWLALAHIADELADPPRFMSALSVEPLQYECCLALELHLARQD